MDRKLVRDESVERRWSARADGLGVRSSDRPRRAGQNLRALRLVLVAGTLSLVGLISAACNESPSDPDAPGGPVTPITELPRALSTNEQQVLTASNTFALNLGGRLLPTKGSNENLFFSPLSASMLLGMVLNGADGETYTQMQNMLAFQGLSQTQINQAYGDLIKLLLELDRSVTMEIGNSVWTQQGFPVMPDFMSRVQGAFTAEAASVNFGDPNTLTRINGWASDATHGRIEKIFDGLPASTVMVLLNAIYFKGNWTTEFDKARTESAPFTRGDGSKVNASLMYLSAPVPSSRQNGVTLVELPYGGGAFSMVVALPDANSSVDALVKGLSPTVWNGWMSALKSATPSNQIVRLPRFELKWEKLLNEPLQALGMTNAFDGRADFRRLTQGGGVYLSIVKQKSFVKVDEVGTEAAAVTGGVMVTSMPQEIRMDRPFVFVLREKLTGAILFMGVLNDPSGDS
jgi:serine protease inhibitor